MTDSELDRQIDAYRSGVRTLPTVVHKLIEYGYGIVDTDGEPYFNEDFCVHTDLLSIQDVVNDLNGDGPENNKGYPYRVVRLMYQEMG